MNLVVSWLREFRRYFSHLDQIKKCFWICIMLLFVEGAMRKWIWPETSSMWVVARDPFVLWIIIQALNKNLIRSSWAKLYMVIASICFVITMTVGHGNLYIALYGFRIWFLHFPLIFIMSRILTRRDLEMILTFLAFVFIPMTLLYVMQFAAPGNSVLNASIGGEVMEQENVVYGAVRPSGTFAHCLGSSYYNPIMTCLLVAMLFSPKFRPYFLKGKICFLVFVGCVVLTLMTSVSRGTIYQGFLTFAIVLAFMLIYGRGGNYAKMAFGLVVLALCVYFLSFINIGGKDILDPITSRFADATEKEGGAEGVFLSRVLEPYVFWHTPNLSLFGEGLGFSSNYAATLLTGDYGFLLGEWSSQMVVGEMGILFGSIVAISRVWLCLSLLPKCLRLLKVNGDALPISLWTLSVQYFANGNFNVSYSMGFIVLTMTLLIASIKNSRPRPIYARFNW